MKTPECFQLSYFSMNGTSMLAVGRIEGKDRVRILKVLADKDAEELYKMLTAKEATM